MSLEYLLDVAIQIEHPNFPQDYMDEDAEALTQSLSSPTDSTDSDLRRRRTLATPSDDDNDVPVKVEYTENTSMLKPTFKYRKAEAARRRRLAIDRRNERRQIVPRSTTDEGVTCSMDRNKTKNRISAASYRENRDKRVSFILNELTQLQNEFPHLQSKPWTPVKKPKSALREGESKDEYRKRTNRESAADSRFHQQQKLQHLTRELARLRQLAQHHRSHIERQ